MAARDAGIASAVADAVEQAGSLPVRGADAEQLALLPADRAPTKAEVDALPRGRGRPRGAKNRATGAWRDYLASRYTHPLETLAAIQSTPADVLAAQLGCKPIEALAVIKSAAAELAPYMEGKMPVAVDLSVKGDLTLAIEGLTHTAQEIAGLVEAEFVDVDPLQPDFEENQSLTHGDREASE
ncbi:hypothetical protein FHS96_004974 [Sphingomonas zeicaulis]|uniref:hypothetical protein n=1 Tax=Sphingomonas zeicaulis TaxID=1632740 RepID=UPI003D1F38CA